MGPGRRRPCWPRPWARTSRHRRPAGLLRRSGTSDQEIGLIDPWRGASPTAATRGSSAPCSPPPSPPCAPTPSPWPTTSANATKANRLGPGRSRPGPPPHPDPARHDPRWSPLRPTTSHETTRRRLTHHIRAPPPGSRKGPDRKQAVTGAASVTRVSHVPKDTAQRPTRRADAVEDDIDASSQAERMTRQHSSSPRDSRPVSTTRHTCQRSAVFTDRLCDSRPHLVNNGGAEMKWDDLCQDPKQIYQSID